MAKYLLILGYSDDIKVGGDFEVIDSYDDLKKAKSDGLNTADEEDTMAVCLYDAVNHTLIEMADDNRGKERYFWEDGEWTPATAEQKAALEKEATASAGDGWVPYKGNSKVLHKIYEEDGTEDGKVFGVIITLMPGAPSFMLQEKIGDHTGKSLKKGSAKTVEENKKKCDEAYEKLGRKAHAASKGCGNKECPGFFVDDITTEIHKCDACNLFESDKKASQYLDGWLSKAGSKLRPSRKAHSTADAGLVWEDQYDEGHNQRVFQATYVDITIDLIEEHGQKNVWTASFSTDDAWAEFKNQKGSEEDLKKKCAKMAKLLFKEKDLTDATIKKVWKQLEATASVNEQFETVYCNKKVSDALLIAMEKDFPWDIARVDDKAFNLYYDTSNIEKSHKVITDLLDKYLGPAGIEVEELAP